MTGKTMKKAKRFGALPPRYTFALNPYRDVRFSKCPKCERPTHLRKFPLLIHIDSWGLMTLGKTCRYCSRCELIIAHQDELESVLAALLSKLAPEVVGNKYLVFGTVERKIWKKGMEDSSTLGETRQYAADFKKYVTLEVDYGGWRPG
jgi:hypothetical protein